MRSILIAIVVFTTLLTSSFLVSAHIFRLHIDKTEYQPGEEIIVTLEIKNTLNVEKEMDIEVTLVEENDKYPPSAWQYLLTLQAGETKNIIVYNETVTDFMVNGEYALTAQLIDDDGFILYEDEVRFTITGLPETMSINLFSSSDEGFTSIEDVFYLNQPVYLGYNTSTEDVYVSGKLVYPDGYQVDITLPYELVVNQTGVYHLYTTASKEGYRSVNSSIQFAVIEEIFHSEKNGTTEVFNPAIHYVFITVIILILVLVVLYLRGKKKLK